jgi:signal transduction histidine kinase/CheY-like chemotaxis protein
VLKEQASGWPLLDFREEGRRDYAFGRETEKGDAMTDLQDIFMPHGQCFLWQPGVLWLNVGSDVVIMAAYYIISVSLFYLLYKRSDVPFRWMFVLFGLFIFACGTTHLLGAWTVWYPDYWTEGAVKAATATLSLSTGLLLVPLLPKAMALRSPSELERLNANLGTALAQRQEAFARLQLSQTELLQRTEELIREREQVRQMASQLTVTEQLERRRLATELHDHLQQMLVLGKLKLGQGKRLAFPLPACVEIMKQVDDVLSEALTYTRTLVAELSPPVLRDHGLAAGLKWLGESMKKHDVTVAVHVPQDNGLTLPEDQTVLLFQSVRELLLNSWKHAGTGTATVTMTHDTDELRIEVRDEGAGFDLAAAAAASAKPTGGLSSKFGLYSIRERMKALGGSFEIESAPGKGTTATLTLPLGGGEALSGKALGIELENEVRHSGSLNAGPQRSTLSGSKLQDAKVRVLLVDDHAMVRQGLRAILDGYADIEVVGEAADGGEGVRLVGELRPRIVVMDINMPRMNGIDATTQIAARWPETIVIGLSVNAGNDNQHAMLKAGASIVLTKEAAVEQLYGAIQQTLNLGREAGR